MSERLRITKPQSEEEIIDELTKDVRGLVTNEETDFLNPGTSGNTSNNPQDIEEPATDTKETTTEKDFDHLETESKSSELSDIDSIDEVLLKDEEMDLSPQEKEERKQTAEQLKLAGNNAFKAGDYELGLGKYSEALRICPLHFPQQRSILYCNRSACYMKLQKHDKALKDCTKAIELDNTYIKAYLRRAHSNEVKEKYDESLADYRKVLELDPSNPEALKANGRLPAIIEERNEKLKNEMMGKLKDLGNMFLKPFGLSTENFQMEQDPDTKGYKINFKQ